MRFADAHRILRPYVRDLVFRHGGIVGDSADRRDRVFDDDFG
jgi:hypothetical protein